MEEAEALCDRVAIIDGGKLVALDTVAGLIRRYGGDSTLWLNLNSPALNTPALAELASVQGVASVNGDGDAVVVKGRGAFAQNVLAYLTQAGLAVRDMETTTPGLEDVFLNLTGRTLRKEH